MFEKINLRLLIILPLSMWLVSCAESADEDDMAFLSDPAGTTLLTEALRELPVGFGDNVRVVTAPLTVELGIADLKGQVYGVTTPSVSGVEVIGDSQTDTAVNVHIESLDEGFWLAPDLVELVDHAPGTTVSMGNRAWTRTEDGEWQEVDPKSID